MDFPLTTENHLAPSLVYYLQKSGCHALANAKLNVDFFEKSVAGGFRYLDTRNRDKSFVIFGELASVEHGTRINAHGDFYLDHPNGGWITDNSTIRDRFALRIPPDGPPLLTHLGRMQIAALNEVRLAALEQEEYDTRDIEISEWLSSESKPFLRDSEEDSIIQVYSKIKFRKPRDVSYGSNPGRTTRDKLRSDQKTSSVNDNTWVGKAFEAKVLPDYDAKIFALDDSRVIQQDIRDTNDCLIPPWETQYSLQPGNLLILQVRLSCQEIDTGYKIKKDQFIAYEGHCTMENDYD
ncbi:hypothetical protein BDN72DRAFT_860493 [Pluteus cervinus]|uniref:Uncharacterized protein n=1 Tax=Pluteus cervinus TaxID=181527 RepID=A0ACD3AIE3_9AGAR|nr:hypothetical protein BDN72DRAFT_860493 [Pluteus cervinus]